MKNRKIVTKSCTFPISCIAYPKAESQLQESLNALIKKHSNVEYLYIYHEGEEGDKPHYHVLLRNNSLKGFQDVNSLLAYFFQSLDSDVKDLNGKVIYQSGESVCYIAGRQFLQTNSLGDWYNYALHNTDYLSEKELSKEFTYSESDIKGSRYLLEDCKNHYTYNNKQDEESDLSLILNCINNNENDVEIISKLNNVRCDNINAIMLGIKAIRNATPVNEELAFQRVFTRLLVSFGFDFEKMLNISKACRKADKLANADDLLFQVVELFCKWCASQNYDIIDILLK